MSKNKLFRVQQLWVEEKERLAERYQNELKSFKDELIRCDAERQETLQLISDEREAYMLEIIRLSAEKSVLNGLLTNELSVSVRNLLKIVNAERMFLITGEVEAPSTSTPLSSSSGSSSETTSLSPNNYLEQGWFTDAMDDPTSVNKDLGSGDLKDSGELQTHQPKLPREMQLLVNKIQMSISDENGWDRILDYLQNYSAIQEEEQHVRTGGSDSKDYVNKSKGFKETKEGLTFNLLSKNLPKEAADSFSEEDQSDEFASSSPPTTAVPNSPLILNQVLIASIIAAVQELTLLRNQARRLQASSAAERGQLLLRIQSLRKKLLSKRKSPFNFAGSLDIGGADYLNDVTEEDEFDDLDFTDAGMREPEAISNTEGRFNLENDRLRELQEKIDQEIRAQLLIEDNPELLSQVEFESKVAKEYCQLYDNSLKRIAVLEAERVGLNIRIRAEYSSRTTELEAQILRMQTDSAKMIAELDRKYADELKDISQKEAVTRRENEAFQKRIHVMESELTSLRSFASSAADDKNRLYLAIAEKEELRDQVQLLRRQLQAALHESRSPLPTQKQRSDQSSARMSSTPTHAQRSSNISHSTPTTLADNYFTNRSGLTTVIPSPSAALIPRFPEPSPASLLDPPKEHVDLDPPPTRLKIARRSNEEVLGARKQPPLFEGENENENENEDEDEDESEDANDVEEGDEDESSHESSDSKQNESNSDTNSQSELGASALELEQEFPVIITNKLDADSSEQNRQQKAQALELFSKRVVMLGSQSEDEDDENIG